MIVLRIEHKVANFEGWKKAFDSDPVGRKQSAVRRYTIFQSADDPNFVIIDLEFDTAQQAEQMLTGLRKMWGQIEGKVVFGPQTRILTKIETVDY